MINLPSLLIIRLERHVRNQHGLETAIDMSIDNDNILNELLSTLKNEQRAPVELDYYCLDLLNNNEYKDLQREFYLMLDYIRFIGSELYRNLKMHGAYVDGLLLYKYVGTRGDALFLQRQDVFFDKIKQELARDNLYSHALLRYS
jgi:hypothetical protein